MSDLISYRQYVVGCSFQRFLTFILQVILRFFILFASVFLLLLSIERHHVSQYNIVS